MAENSIIKKHKIRYTQGESIELQGVVNVVDYSDTVMNIKLSDCYITVKGDGFKVLSLNVDSGEMSVTGRISMITYSKTREKVSFFKRITK